MRTGRFWKVGPRSIGLVEWDYGEYEGRTTADIQRIALIGKCFVMDALAVNHRPRSACEPTASIKRLRAVEGDVLLVSSGHFLRVFAARWLGSEPGERQFSF